ncbi:MAG: WD40 repeat domain-containing protein [Planctomycetota bacterium]|jgi:WD40 repeat protein
MEDSIEYKKHKRQVREIVSSRDGRRIASAGNYFGEVRVWDPHTGKTIRILKPEMRYGASNVAFSNDGCLCAGGFGVLGVRVWDIDTGTIVHRNDIHTLHLSCKVIAFSPDSRQLLTIDRNHALWIVDLHSGEKSQLQDSGGKPARARCVAFTDYSPRAVVQVDDDHVAVCASDNGSVAYVLQGCTTFSGEAGLSRGDAVAVFSASNGSNGIDIWRSRLDASFGLESKGEETLPLSGVSPDGTRMVVCRPTEDLSIHDIATGRRLHAVGSASPHIAAFVDDDTLLVVDGSEGLTVWKRRFPESWWGHLLRPEVVVGAMGVFVLAVALRHWLGERRKFLAGIQGHNPSVDRPPSDS